MTLKIKSKKHGEQIVLFDAKDHSLLKHFKWHVERYKGGNTLYVCAIITNSKLKKTTLKMHRLIMNPIESQEVDHINGNGLDNRRKNLRICSHSQNGKNHRINKNNKSGYKGVSKCITKSKHKNKTYVYEYWLAQICKDFKRIFLGKFKNKEDAFKSYCEASKKYHGEFGRIS